MGSITINKLILITSFLLVNTFFTFGQYDTIRNGAYRNTAEFNNNNPIYTCDFEFTNAAYSKIPELYKVKPLDKKIKTKSFKYEIGLIKSDSSIYLNVYRLGMIYGFVKIYPIQIYGCFEGIYIEPNKYNPGALLLESGNHTGAYPTDYLTTSPALFYIRDSDVAENLANKRKRDEEKVRIKEAARNKLYYVFNLKSGMTNLLTKEYMLRILELKPEYAYLLELFEKEANNDLYEVCRKYLECVNHIKILE